MSQQMKVCVTPKDGTKLNSIESDPEVNSNSLMNGCYMHQISCWCSLEPEEPYGVWGEYSIEDLVYDYAELFSFEVNMIYLRQCLLDTDFLYFAMTRSPVSEHELLCLRRVYTGKIVTESGYLDNDEVVIVNPRRRRGVDAPIGEDCAMYAGVQHKKQQWKKEFKRKLSAKYNAKRKTISERKNSERVFSFDDTVFVDVEEKSPQIIKSHTDVSALCRELNRLVVAANLKNKAEKRKRKQSRRVVTEGIHDRMYLAYKAGTHPYDTDFVSEGYSEDTKEDPAVLDYARQHRENFAKLAATEKYLEENGWPKHFANWQPQSSSEDEIESIASSSSGGTAVSRLEALKMQMENYNDEAKYGSGCAKLHSTADGPPQDVHRYYYDLEDDEKLIYNHLRRTEAIRNQQKANSQLWFKTASFPSIMGIEIKDIYDKFCGTFGPLIAMTGENGNLVSTFMDVVTYIYLVRKCSADVDFIMLTRWFVCCTMKNKTPVDQTAIMAVIVGIGGFAKVVINIVKSMSKTKNGTIVTEGFFSDSIDSFASFIKNIHESSIISAIRNIAISIAALKLLDFSVAKHIFRFCGKSVDNGPVDLITTILTAVASIVRAGELVCEGIPLSHVLLGNDPLNEALREGRRLSAFSDMLYYGLPVNGRMEESIFVSQTEKILPILKNAMKKVNPFSPVFKQCNDIVSVLHPAWEGVKNRILGSSRMAPFGIIVSSEPGVGKSSILPWCGRILANVMDRPYDDSQTFHRIKSSDFFEGYDPFSHKIIHYSELGASTAAYARMHGDDIVTELTSVIDNVSLPINMAFEKKGKTFFNSELVLIDTNNVGLNLSEFVNNEAAFKRRFLYIIPTVKKEFRVEGGCGLDPSKCIDNLRMMDRFTFFIYREKQISAKKSKSYVLGEDVDCDRAYDIIRQQMETHFATQKRVVEGSRADVERPYGTLGFEAEVPSPQSLGSDFNMPDYAVLEEKGDVESYDKRGNWMGSRSIRRRGHVVTEADGDIDPIPGGWYQLITGLFDVKPYCRGYDMNYVRFLGQYYLYLGDCMYNSITCSLSLSMYSFIPDTWITMFMKFMKLFYLLFSVTASIGIASHSFIWGVIMFLALHYIFHDKVFMIIENEMDRRRALKANLSEANRRFRVAIGSDTSNILFCSAVALSTYLISGPLIRMIMSFFTSISTETQTDFKIPSESNSKLNEIEAKIGTQRAVRRSPGLIPDCWVTQAVRTPIVHTNGPKTLDDSISQNCRSAIVEWGTNTSRTSILGVCEDYILINRHCLPVSGVFTLKVNMTGVRADIDNYRSSLVSVDALVRVTDDIVLVRISQMQFKDVSKHFCDAEFNFATGFICGDQISIKRCGKISAANKIHGNVVVNDTLRYTWSRHSKGACGTPIIVGMSNRAFIAGLHYAGDEMGTTSFGVAISKRQLDEALVLARSNRNLMRIVSQSDHIVSLNPPKRRSPFNFEDLHCLEYLGSDDQIVSVNNRSAITKTKYGDRCADVLKAYGFAKTVHFAPPLLRPVKTGSGVWVNPFTKNLHKLNTRKKPLDVDILSRCVERFVAHITSNIDVTISPIPLEEAVNGALYDQSLRRINVRTGSGYGFAGKKYKVLPIVDDTPGRLLREPTNELKTKIIAKYDMYFNGHSDGAIFGAKLKDEPRQVEKVIAGKTRMFFPSQVDLLVVSRSVLGPFFTLMVANRKVFMSSVGIDMYTEGHELRNDLASFSGNVFEGDYGGFDTSMPFEIGLGASTVLHDVCEKLGYDEAALDVLRGVLSDNLFPVVEVNGDIMCVPGLMTSGSYGTAEFNCIRNVLLMMYFFEATPGLTLDDFFNKVQVTTYGDDVLGTVHDSISNLFNCRVYAKFCVDTFGMDFTTSDKGEVTSDFTTIDKMSFLKRQFKYNADVERFTAVLDENTLFKMVEWHTPSSDLSEIDQAIATCTSLIYEVAMWLDRDRFTAFRSDIQNILRECFDRPDISLPTWAKIVSRINPTAITLREEEECNGEVGGELIHESLDDPSLKISGDVFTESLLSGDRFLHKKFEWQAEPLDRVILLEDLKKQREDTLLENKELFEMYDDVHPLDLMRGSNEAFSLQDTLFHKYRAAWAKVDSLTATIASIERAKKKTFRSMHIVTEAEVGQAKSGPIDAGATEAVENVIDVAGTVEDTSVVGVNTQPMEADDFDVKKYLNRPVQLAAIELGLGGPIDLKINVWDLYTSDPTVRSKLRNYAFMKCDLKVKIAISGTPFHYAKILMSYQPFPAVNAVLNSFGVSHRLARLKYLSQAPGAKVVDVKSNQPLEITCPYVSPRPIGRLFNDASSVISSATPITDFSELGSLYVSTINDVKACSTNPTSAYLYVYAYADNVHLHGSTATQMAIVTESDEREVGPVERMSSSMVQVSEAVKKVPWLAPYASISSMAFGALRQLSALFGWSYPTMISMPHRVRPDPFQNGAQTIGYDTGKRITLDPKQELAPNIGVSGESKDELVIADICKRESLVDTFAWGPETPSMTSVLWAAAVSPRAQKVEIFGLNVYANPTPLAFAAAPFLYWRGTITYRFEVVASSFHRAKFMVVYEPNISTVNLITPQAHLNKQYVRIIDIQETQDVEFTVEWNFSRPWASALENADVAASMGDQLVFTPSMADACNGMIYVVPFTQLQSPDDGSIEINVYVRSDDMCFNRLSDKHITNTPGYIVTEGDIADTALSSMPISKAVLPLTNIASECFGEMPISFRALLKRFMTGALSDTGGARNYYWTWTLPLFPQVSDTLTLYHYLKWAYLCQRGAFRRRLRIPASCDVVGVLIDGQVTVSNAQDTSVNFITPTTVSGSRPLVRMEGSVQYNATVNNGYEFEIPFYTNNLFAWACNADPFLQTSAMSPEALRTYIVNYEYNDNVRAVLYESYASGEDFNLSRWLGAYPYVLYPIG